MADKEIEATGKDIQLEVAGGPAGGFAAGIAIGVLLGAAVALLFAPARGEVTRARRIRPARRHVPNRARRVGRSTTDRRRKGV